MRSRVVLVVAAAAIGAALASATPAVAQYGSMTEVPEVPLGHAPNARTTPATPAQVLRGAACAVSRDAGTAAALLATVPRSNEERTQATAFLRAARRCFSPLGQAATSAMALRGAAAEALNTALFKTAPAARSPVLAAAPMARPNPGSDPAVAAMIPGFALADCVASRHPELVRTLLAAEPMSPAEQTAFAALNPVFIDCLVPGTQLQLGAREIRNLLAEALYRWSVVQRDGPASPWAAAPSG